MHSSILKQFFLLLNLVADDTEEECEDYSATTGTLPFQNSVMIDRSEKFSEEAQAVLDCHVTSR